MSILKTPVWLVANLCLLANLAAAEEAVPNSAPRQATARYAIAIHGGCGTADRLLPDEIQKSYHDSLSRALSLGKKLLADRHASIDVVEQVARALENDPNFNAGRGSVVTRNGGHELDASIMDGRTMACGAVANVRTVQNPISLARLVMEKTNHVLLVGPGAEAFASDEGIPIADPEYFSTPRIRELWQAYQKDEKVDVSRHDLGLTRGTIGVVARDVQGNLAAATSTGGVCFKMPGRVGDSPIVGAGTFAKNELCAVSCTGRGEEFIRHGVARTIAALMRYKGYSLQKAVDQVIQKELAEGVGAAIAVGADGSIAIQFNTTAMLRGAADSSGRFETAIWREGTK